MTRFFTFSHLTHHLIPHKYWLQTTSLKFYCHFDQNQIFYTPLFCKFPFSKHYHKLLFSPLFLHYILKTQKFIFVPMPDDLTFWLSKQGVTNFVPILHQNPYKYWIKRQLLFYSSSLLSQANMQNYCAV